MANQKITELVELTTPIESDVLPIVDLVAGITKKIPISTLRDKFVASATGLGTVKLKTAPVSAANPIAVGDNDPRIPTTDQGAALAGTGTPSASNKFVTADTDALKEVLTNKSTDTALGTSDTKYPSQKAVKAYVDSSPASRKVGSDSRSMATASGTVNYAHGLGRIPKKVRINACFPVASQAPPHYMSSDGLYDGSTTVCLRRAQQANDYAVVDIQNNIIYIVDTNGNGQYATITVDATNLIIAWTKAGSSGGTIVFTWEVE